MRIIAGTSKGKTLLSPPETTRPTSDRAREGLFSSLESEFGSVSELAFLDLFAGSGAVGVEALSRGASSVYSVEQHEATATIARKNFELVNNPAGDFAVINSSVDRFLTSPGLPQGFTFDIIFMDPPYPLPNDEIEKILRTIYENGFLANRGLIAIERESRSKAFTWPEPFIAEKVRSYGQGSIFYGGLPASVLP